MLRRIRTVSPGLCLFGILSLQLGACGELPDETSPELTLETDLPSVSTQADHPISGTVESGANLTVVIEPEGALVDPVDRAGTSWDTTLHLVEGGNTLTITAIDARGNSHLIKRAITKDTTAPTLTTPAAENATLSVLTEVPIVFNEAVKKETVSVQVTGPEGIVDGALTADAPEQAAYTWVPSAPLFPQTVYTVTIASGVEDAMGNATQTPIIRSFTTP